MTVIKDTYAAPAVIFEEETGLTGISNQWNLPRGLSYAAFEQLLFPSLQCITKENKVEQLSEPAKFYALQNVYDDLVALNPLLGKLNSMRDNPHQLKNIIFGVSSQFNLDDIIYFNTTTVDDREKPDVVSLENAIAIRTGTQVRWQPSPTTLKNILHQMRDHPIYCKTFLNEQTVTLEMLTKPKGGSELFWDESGVSNRKNHSRWVVIKEPQVSDRRNQLLHPISSLFKKLTCAKLGM